MAALDFGLVTRQVPRQLLLSFFLVFCFSEFIILDDDRKETPFLFGVAIFSTTRSKANAPFLLRFSPLRRRIASQLQIQQSCFFTSL